MTYLIRFLLTLACLGPLTVFILAMIAAVELSQAHAQGLRLTVDPKAEVRYCGPPARDADGTIIRSAAVLYAFRKIHPCPVTGLTTGACPRWQMNHIWPLSRGGCDAVSNLMWMPVEIKTCAQPWCVDRWERTYWGDPHGIVVFKPDPAASAP